MANKNVLRLAINKLEDANLRLFEKLCKTPNGNKKEAYRKQIAKNDTMILDYKFRLSNETE